MRRGLVVDRLDDGEERECDIKQRLALIVAGECVLRYDNEAGRAITGMSARRVAPIPDAARSATSTRSQGATTGSRSSWRLGPVALLDTLSSLVESVPLDALNDSLRLGARVETANHGRIADRRPDERCRNNSTIQENGERSTQVGSRGLPHPFRAGRQKLDGDSRSPGPVLDDPALRDVVVAHQDLRMQVDQTARIDLRNNQALPRPIFGQPHFEPNSSQDRRRSVHPEQVAERDYADRCYRERCRDREPRAHRSGRPVHRRLLQNRPPNSVAFRVKARGFVTERVGVLQQTFQAAHWYLLRGVGVGGPAHDGPGRDAIEP